ncbi:MAG: thermonuclease family protein [Nitrospirota bacterium]|jgi:endonuclease YncB( thermonuclease family)
MLPRVAIKAVLLTAAFVIVHGTVARVKDGDTVVVDLGPGGSIVCRLYAIDAPERRQPFGAEAAEALERLLGEAEEVEVTLTGSKSYGREICVLEKDGRNINVEMTRLGLAWVARPYLDGSGSGAAYIAAEMKARQLGLGLWGQSLPIPPWQWRRGARAVE